MRKYFGLISPEVSKELDKVTYLYDTEPTLSMVAEESAHYGKMFSAILKKALEDYPDLLAVGKGHQSRSQFKKCISIWDWLKYSNAAKIR